MIKERLLREPSDQRGADIFFLAGEHSGDEHAAKLVNGLRERSPDLKMAAVGGQRLSESGVRVLHDLTKNSVVGLVEVLRHYKYFKKLFNEVVEWIDTYRPSVVVLVDYPGFNLRLAAELAKRGISRKGGGVVSIYQYISPQIWAWKPKRRFKMAEAIDELGVIFPFETECYSDTELPAHFVGHPFVGQDYKLPLKFNPDGAILALPGSRKQPVARILPLMLQAIKDAKYALRPVYILYPDDNIKAEIERILPTVPLSPAKPIELKKAGEVVEASAVITSSGTMSLNCALAGIPGVIAYYAHPLTYFIGRRLVKIDYLGIANLILGETMYPEFVQDAAKSKELAEALALAVRGGRTPRFIGQKERLVNLLSTEAKESPVSRILALMNQG